MANVVRLNFDRMQIDEQFQSLPVVLESMENHLSIAAEFEVDRVYARHREDWDDDEVVTQLAADEVEYLRRSVFPRVFRGSLIITIFAAFEDSVGVLERVARQKNPSSAPRDFREHRAQSFVDACCYYFCDSLEYGLWDNDTVDALRLLGRVRNTFAHQAGRLGKKERKVFKSLMSSKTPRLKDWHGYLVPSREYVSDALDLCTRAVHELADQVMPGVRAVEVVDKETEEQDEPG